MDRIVYQIEESQDGKSYIAFCPELIITSFGDSPEAARAALQAEISAYLEDCEALGVLEEVLIEAGFYDDGEGWVSDLVIPVKRPKLIVL